MFSRGQVMYNYAYISLLKFDTNLKYEKSYQALAMIMKLVLKWAI